MKNLFKGIVLSLLFVMSSTGAYSYITASDLRYEYVGNGNYTFYLDVYTECDGAVDLEKIPFQKLIIESPKLGIELVNALTVNLTKIKKETVYILCSNKAINCQGGSVRGLEKFTYKGTMNFGQLTETDDWLVYWAKNFRSVNLTTTNNSVNQAYYVETTLNTKDIASNSSPVFHNSPIITAIIGEENVYNPQIEDTDGDELRFEIVSPRISADVDILYKNGFDETNPVTAGTPMTIDSEGKITFSPTVAGEIGIVDILVSEYRNGQLIATTSRAIQFNTFDDVNNAPVMTGFNGGTSFDTTFCAGENLTIDDLYILGSDVDETLTGLDKQNISFEVIGKGVTQQQAIPTGGRKLGFNWSISDADVGTHVFSVKLKDDACPVSRDIIQEFTITVRSRPQFSLGKDTVIACNTPFVMTPSIMGGQTPYTYTWKDGLTTLLEDTPVFSTTKPGNINFTVEDAFGCKSTDEIKLQKSITGLVTHQTWCFGKPITFTAHVTTLFTSIVRYEWHFDDNDNGLSSVTGTDQESYTYLNNGEHEPYLIVEDDKGCIDTLKREVKLCTAPTFDFIVRDSCNNHVIIEDRTAYGEECALVKMTPNKGVYYPKSNNSNGYFEYGIEKAEGSFPFSTKATLLSTCVIDSTFSVNLIKTPEVQLLEGGQLLQSFAYNCDDPDTTLRASLIDTGHGGITWNWALSLPYIASNQVNDSIYTTDSPGFYSVEVRDKENCRDTASVAVLELLSADFNYDIVCAFGEEVQFNNRTLVGDIFSFLLGVNVAIDRYEWNFGDGSMVTAENAKENPVHTYTTEGDYDVTLTVYDVNGCSSTKMQTVFYSFPDNNFRLDPDLTLNPIICAKNDTIIGHAPNLVHADKLTWNNGSGGNYTYSGSNIDQGREQVFLFPTDGDYKITLAIEYNENIIYDLDGTPIETIAEGLTCTRSYEDNTQIINIKPELAGTLEGRRYCVGDTAKFEFIQTKGGNITSVDWYLFDFNTSQVILNEQTTEPLLEKVLNQRYYIDYIVKVTDDIGCDIYLTPGNSVGHFQMQEIVKATLSVTDTSCANEYSTFEIKVEDIGEVENWYVVDNNTGMRIPPNPNKPSETDINYVPGDFGLHSIDNGIISYKFDQSGENSVTVFMQGTIGEVHECNSLAHATVFVAPVPVIDFTVTNPVCASDETTLITNSSTVVAPDKIESYLWDFKDGTTSTEEHPTHVFEEGGFQPISLTVTASKCSDTKTATNEVYVKYKPKADFIYDEDFLEAYIPITFTDNTTSGSQITEYFYDFDDGTTSTEATVDHTYDKIAVYQVKHSVKNIEGCSDTITKRTDLNVYLDIPTAFSPNGDGNNDVIGLIHKAIKNIDEYKIYNRWGQVVFDGGDDPDLTWDGTMNGVNQEMGVYVVIVKGQGAYETSFQFKKNLTLLR